MLVLHLKAHRPRIVISRRRVIHGDDASCHVRPVHSQGAMQVVCKRGDAATPWEVISDERDALKRFH
jgi:hypothetical protein